MGRGPALTAEHADRVRRRAADVAGAYDALRQTAERLAVTWRWATPTSGCGDLRPLRLERMGCSPGRWLDRAPAEREHAAIGFEAGGRVVCAREHDATGAVWLERFTTWSGDVAEIACFRSPLRCAGVSLPAVLQALTFVRLEGGLPVDSERFLPPTGWSTRERYRHVGARLTRVEEDGCDEDGGPATVIKEVLYGDDGGVERIDALAPDGRRVVWRREQRGHATRHGARPGGGRLRRQDCL
jgi:hypothetical protein